MDGEGAGLRVQDGRLRSLSRSSAPGRSGPKRPYRSEEVRSLAALLFERWPGVFVADGLDRHLDVLVAPSLRLVVWVQGVTDPVPGVAAGQRLVMVPRDWDREITLRVVAKRLRQQAARQFEPHARRLTGRR